MCRVEAGFAVAGNVARIGSFQPGYAVDEACFARTGWAKNNSNAAFGQVKAQLQLKRATVKLYVYFQHAPSCLRGKCVQATGFGSSRLSRVFTNIRGAPACINKYTVFGKSVMCLERGH